MFSWSCLKTLVFHVFKKKMFNIHIYNMYIYIYIKVLHKDNNEQLKQCLKPSQRCFFFCQKSVPLLRPWIYLEVDLEFLGGFICQFRVKRFWDPFFEFCFAFCAALESCRLLGNYLFCVFFFSLGWVFFWVVGQLQYIISLPSSKETRSLKNTNVSIVLCPTIFK